MTKMASSSTEIYQSPGDRQRLEILLKTMRESGFNLAILGPDDITLAHYTRRIYEHLRQDPSLQVELWSSMESDKLIERFNTILAELTVEQALDKSRKSEVRRYMIFPDAQSVQDFELQLLARLINGFPASNIHVVLLINRKESYERKLEAFGKHLMRWTLETEQPEPVRMKRIETREEAASPAPAAEPGFEWPTHTPELPPEVPSKPASKAHTEPDDAAAPMPARRRRPAVTASSGRLSIGRGLRAVRTNPRVQVEGNDASARPAEAHAV